LIPNGNSSSPKGLQKYYFFIKQQKKWKEISAAKEEKERFLFSFLNLRKILLVFTF
jgi:hypothetical protein